ncbi:hypothetical protein [Paenibacillus sanguinis]|uniref:hypothetical protein n=1 Tax=Paenibacillus sanguinis TaxID=225906 RepID=UPI000381F460|nr:hypothetical protein [Paenibacillus sanguinis]
MKNGLLAVVPLLLMMMFSSVDARLATPGWMQAEPEVATAALFVEAPDSLSVTVYLHDVQMSQRGGVLLADPIQWYEGEQAGRVFAEREPDAGIDGPPDGYYIVNDTEEQITYSVAPDAEVRLQIYDRTKQGGDMNIQWNEAVSPHQFSKLFHQRERLDLGWFPYHLTITEGQVVRIVQQYIP